MMAFCRKTPLLSGEQRFSVPTRGETRRVRLACVIPPKKSYWAIPYLETAKMCTRPDRVVQIELC